MKHPESGKTFCETCAQVEKWSRIMTFLATKVTPLCGVLSRAIPSFFFYFATDLGNEAFELPVKMW